MCEGLTHTQRVGCNTHNLYRKQILTIIVFISANIDLNKFSKWFKASMMTYFLIPFSFGCKPNITISINPNFPPYVFLNYTDKKGCLQEAATITLPHLLLNNEATTMSLQHYTHLVPQSPGLKAIGNSGCDIWYGKWSVHIGDPTSATLPLRARDLNKAKYKNI